MSDKIKAVIFKKKIEGIIYDLMVRTDTKRVMVDENTTLEKKLEEMIASIAGKVTSEAGKSLILDTLIQKIEELPDNAELIQSLEAITTELKQYTDDSIASMGTIFKVQGRKDTFEELPTEGNQVGHLWLVGAIGAEQVAEYYWLEEGRWDLLGYTTKTDLSDYYTKAEIDTKIGEKADKTAFEAHVGDDTHLTPAEKKRLQNTSGIVISADEPEDWDENTVWGQVIEE